MPRFFRPTFGVVYLGIFTPSRSMHGGPLERDGGQQLNPAVVNKVSLATINACVVWLKRASASNVVAWVMHAAGTLYMDRLFVASVSCLVFSASGSGSLRSRLRLRRP